MISYASSIQNIGTVASFKLQGNTTAAMENY